MKASVYCPYCHRYTLLSHAKMIGNIAEELFWKDTTGGRWWIGICNNCIKPTLVLEEGLLVFPYPIPTATDERIPEDIRIDLDEAKRCLHINAFRACAVMARRSMQTACIDKGSKKERLVEQLHELAENGIITKDLKEWGDVVRWIGNDAAHPDKQKVTKEDAEDILHLAEQFLHVIYVAPAIAQERRGKRGK